MIVGSAKAEVEMGIDLMCDKEHTAQENKHKHMNAAAVVAFQFIRMHIWSILRQC